MRYVFKKEVIFINSELVFSNKLITYIFENLSIKNNVRTIKILKIIFFFKKIFSKHTP